MNDGDYPIISLVDAATAADKHARHEIGNRRVYAPRRTVPWDSGSSRLAPSAEAIKSTGSLRVHALGEYGKAATCRPIVDQDLRVYLRSAQSLKQVKNRRSGPDNEHFLVFTASTLSVELEVMSGCVVGQVVPPGPGVIRVEAAAGVTFHVEADDLGFFELPGLPPGPVRLRCDTPTARLVTDWVRL
jgi:hypothetical protein